MLSFHLKIIVNLNQMQKNKCEFCIVPHSFRAGRHEVECPLGGLDAEGDLGVGTLHGVQVVHVHVLDSLENDFGVSV